MAGRNIYGELLRAQLHNSASDLTPTATGLVYFNTTTGLKWYDGSAWRTAVELTSAQVITNKDIDGGTAANTRRITIPKDTTTNLNALTRKQGTLVYDTTTNEVKFDDGTSLTAFSSQIQATATTLGVVKGGTVPGTTSGSATGAGYIGEVISATLSTGSQVAPTGSANDITNSSIVLTPGLWQFYMRGTGEVLGGSGDGGGWVSINDNSNNLIPGGLKAVFQPNGVYIYGGIFDFSPPPVLVTSTTTYKARLFRSTTNGTVTFYHTNTSSGDSKFFAVRIG